MKIIIKIIFIFALMMFVGDEAFASIINKAIIFNKKNSDNIYLYYNNIFYLNKRKNVLPDNKLVVLFDENSYQPTLVHFSTRILPEKDSLLIDGVNGNPWLEQPVIVVLPGDSVAVSFNKNKNSFKFTGRHQVELDFCQRIWKSQLSLTETYFEMSVSNTMVSLNHFLVKWHSLKLEGESIISELNRSSEVRPQVAAFLARQLKLRLFTILTLPAVYQLPKDSLRVFTNAYTDSVASEIHILDDFKNAPITDTDGLIRALTAYTAYECVKAREYPTAKAMYLRAKRENIGFRRAWICFAIIEEAKARHKNISWLLQDYQRWVHPYDEFVRVLKGNATVSLRSYKGPTVFADSIMDTKAQHQHLSELLARYKGQAILLDLWASWCRPCLEEMPASIALANKYRSKGLIVLFLSIDEDPVVWQRAFKNLPKGIRNLYRFVSPANAAFLKELEVTAVPHYVLIDRHGQISYPEALRPSDLRLEPILEKLLKL